MGTALYGRGVFLNKCFDELNLTQPELVRSVHEEYLQAGAEIIETNTFGANSFRLQRFGLQDQTRAINQAGVQVMRLVRRLREELKVNTSCGASNVSFGLPNRDGINSAFLTMAMAAGLTSAITNPMHIEVIKAVMGADVMLGHDPDCARWIRRFRDAPPPTGTGTATGPASGEGASQPPMCASITGPSPAWPGSVGEEVGKNQCQWRIATSSAWPASGCQRSRWSWCSQTWPGSSWCRTLWKSA